MEEKKDKRTDTAGGKKPRSSDADRREAVLAILRRQAADLEAERAAGSIDEDEYEEARSELKRRVLEEAKTDSAAKSGKSLTATRILAIVCAVLIPASAVFGYLALGRYTAMDPDFIAMMAYVACVEGGVAM